mmetsp:Transcript_14528/g.24815  ORF Transcript_14528/g.24815 Transcript_14528/m.24815 type:complete len:200 (+) Transcript_14528:33-632(+)
MRSELGCPIARVVARLFSLNLFQTKASPKAEPSRKEEASIKASKESIEGSVSVDYISAILGKPQIPVAAARLATTADDLPEVLNDELVAVSSRFEELFGYSRHELQGKSILRLLSITGMVDPQLEIYLNMVEQGTRMLRGVQVSLRRKTGELVGSQVYIKKAALPGAAGEVEEVLLFYFSDLGVVEVDSPDDLDGCSML